MFFRSGRLNFSIVQKRFYRYSKYGELISHPLELQSQQLRHPVLGTYLSEYKQVPTSPLLSSKYSSPLVKLNGRDLMKSLREYHMNQDKLRSDMLNSSSSSSCASDTLSLGQLVYIRRRLCLSKPQTQSFLGVIIEVVKKGPHSSIRVRGMVLGTGVELLIPVFSPLVESIQIVKKPEKVPVGPNLFGVRDRPDEMARFMDPVLMTEKGRIALIKKLNQQQLHLQSNIKK